MKAMRINELGPTASHLNKLIKMTEGFRDFVSKVDASEKQEINLQEKLRKCALHPTNSKENPHFLFKSQYQLRLNLLEFFPIES